MYTVVHGTPARRYVASLAISASVVRWRYREPSAASASQEASDSPISR